MTDTEQQIQSEQARLLHGKGDLRAAADIYRTLLKAEPDNAEILNLLGSVLMEANLHEQAQDILARALVVGGPNSGVLFNYGVALRAGGQLDGAARAFKNAAEADPGNADVWFNLGETYRRLGRHADAVAAFEKAVERDSTSAAPWFNLGNALTDAEQLERAEEAYQAALEIDPDHIDCLNNLGVLQRRAGRAEDSLSTFGRAIAAAPIHPAAHDNRGVSYAELGRPNEAIAGFTEAIRLAPDYAEAQINLGGLYLEQHDFARAHTHLSAAFTINPQLPEARLKLGVVLQKMNRLDEARALLAEGLVLAPGDADLLAALGNVCRDLGEFDAAGTHLEQAQEAKPESTAVRANRALLHQHMGDLDGAVAVYRQALEGAPELPSLHTNLAHTFLIGENYDDGWQEFEWRLEEAAERQKRAALPGRPWDGTDLTGHSLLVTCEQGFGDILQFARYLSALRQTCGEMTVAAPARLQPLLASLGGDWTWIDTGGDHPAADFHVPLMSLPHLMPGCADPADAPVAFPYLGADKERSALWRERIKSERLKIGIAWQGNPAYAFDYLRSIPLAYFAPLLEKPEIDVYSLQKGGAARQITDNGFETKIIDLTGEMDDEAAFIDSAALTENLDLIITSDTSVPHLAGALGRPVWMMLASAPDWRWGMGRTDSPWYPTMRLFRQPTPGNWAAAIEAVSAGLDLWREEGGGANSAADTILGPG